MPNLRDLVLARMRKLRDECLEAGREDLAAVLTGAIEGTGPGEPAMALVDDEYHARQRGEPWPPPRVAADP